MSINKLIQIVFFILKRNNLSMNYMKLIKLLYLADRAALDAYGETITENSAVSMDQGPVLSELYDYIKNSKHDDAQRLWNNYFVKNKHSLDCINTDIDDGELCEYEESILEEIDNLYKDKTPWQMVDLVHNVNVCPEWRDPNGSALPIRTNEVLSYLGYSKEERDFLLKNATVYKAEHDKLSRVISC
ncbi:MAG: SocA family protein [Treponema sp.]|nr:SocA family protein [Treponema sp.]